MFLFQDVYIMDLLLEHLKNITEKKQLPMINKERNFRVVGSRSHEVQKQKTILIN